MRDLKLKLLAYPPIVRLLPESCNSRSLGLEVFAFGELVLTSASSRSRMEAFAMSLLCGGLRLGMI